MWARIRAVLPKWACGAAGSALPWHGRGRRFDPDQVHQTLGKISARGLVSHPTTCYNSLQIRNFLLMTPWELRRLILRIKKRESEAAMFTVQLDNSGEVAVLQCTGRF